MTPMWRYFYATVTMFIIAPELRRVQDLLIGFSNFQLLSILPYLMLIPFFYVVGMHERYKRIPRVIMTMAWLWAGAFTYSLFISFISNNLFGGLFTYMQFVLPMGVGIWLATEELPSSVVFGRLMRYLFTITTAICVYGIIQWIVVPPWDALWLNEVSREGAISFGIAQPFQIRVFSTLNAPGPFGILVALVAILALPKLSIRNVKWSVSFGIWMVALSISLVRTSWIMLLLGSAIYFLLMRRFKPVFGILALATCVTIGIGTLDPNSPLVTTVSDRVSSLGDIQSDNSYNERSGLYVEMLPQISQLPIGMGLGVFGGAAKLNSSGYLIDSGILSRTLEMGWAGAGLLALTLFIGLNYAFKQFLLTRTAEQNTSHERFALLVALQVSLLFLEFSGESHIGLLGILFWAPLAAVSLPPLRVGYTAARNGAHSFT